MGIASGRVYPEVRICSQDGQCLHVHEQEKIIDGKERGKRPKECSRMYKQCTNGRLGYLRARRTLANSQERDWSLGLSSLAGEWWYYGDS